MHVVWSFSECTFCMGFLFRNKMDQDSFLRQAIARRKAAGEDIPACDRHFEQIRCSPFNLAETRVSAAQSTKEPDA